MYQGGVAARQDAEKRAEEALLTASGAGACWGGCMTTLIGVVGVLSIDCVGSALLACRSVVSLHGWRKGFVEVPAALAATCTHYASMLASQ